MKKLAVAGLSLYGAANVIAGVAGLAIQPALPPKIVAALVATGLLLVAAGVLTLRGSRHAFQAAVAALAPALTLAIYNERVLGLGHPSHHVLRVVFTFLILGAIWRAGRSSATARPG